MVGIFIDNFQSMVPVAVLIWLVLIGVVAALVAVVLWPNRTRQAPARARHAKVSTRCRRARAAAARRADLCRYAEEVEVAARRSVAIAQRRHAEWLAAYRFKETAWRRYDTAGQATLRFARASAFPATQAEPTPQERAVRQQLLRRAAVAALRQGELSAQQLNDVLRHRNGWDLDRHPCEHETKLRLIGQSSRLRVYLSASAVEQVAWRSAQAAAVACRALADEAAAAAREAGRPQPRRVAQPLPASVRVRATSPVAPRTVVPCPAGELANGGVVAAGQAVVTGQTIATGKALADMVNGRAIGRAAVSPRAMALAA